MSLALTETPQERAWNEGEVATCALMGAIAARHQTIGCLHAAVGRASLQPGDQLELTRPTLTAMKGAGWVALAVVMALLFFGALVNAVWQLVFHGSWYPLLIGLPLAGLFDYWIAIGALRRRDDEL